ncbi:hypothetical protein BLNAU_10096 [Blattamonas nauphoetae]|uniref:Uncharacterized protein n=1 Tax=Blattamonas nauphoetae TaxID=2049346 RepID=A0ABQ9XU02_9EUKA|nr:hypothetical protein BLNAU_10096 [Blattamonas nauphoetae]
MLVCDVDPQLKEEESTCSGTNPNRKSSKETSWLKNQSYILSTPLLFRPIYNTILHSLLHYILKHFATVPSKNHPGAAIFITGDQGIGKTSLMLVLMSTLSELKIGFLYRKGTKSQCPPIFYHTIDQSGEMDFTPEDEIGPLPEVHIDILDDCFPPIKLCPGTLTIIFTSPDPNRMNIAADTSIIRYFFRLPTFSLAEDAVAMVGCTPNVPFSLLSPEDMELRVEEQKTLLSIEQARVESTRQLPSETEATTITPEQESAKEFMKAMANSSEPIVSNFELFVSNVVSHLLSNTQLEMQQFTALQTFLTDATDEHDWEAIKTPLETAITNTFETMEDNTDSILEHISRCLGQQAVIDPFFLSLYRSFLDSRGQPTKTRLSTILERWISHLDIHPREHDMQETVVKEVLVKLILSDWNKQETVHKAGQDEESETEERSLDIEKKKTNALFDFVLAHIQPHRNVNSRVDKISASIKDTILADPSVLSAPSQLEDTLTSQLKSLKEHFKEPDLAERGARQQLQEKVKKIRGVPDQNEQELQSTLMDCLIDILTTRPSYDSNQLVLQSLFVLPESTHFTDPGLFFVLSSLLKESKKKGSDKEQLQFIVDELIKHLRFTDRKMARIACDILTTIVDPRHKAESDRLETVKQEIRDVRDHLSFMRLMDSFFIIARNMNILVSPHSILKATGMLLELIRAPETDCVNDHKDATTRMMQLEERVVDTVTLSILKNVNGVINTFNEIHERTQNSVDNSRWLAVLRSMMNSILFLIDAGLTRRCILDYCGGLEKLLEDVHEAHKRPLRGVADYKMHQGAPATDSDYVNDVTILSTPFEAHELHSHELPAQQFLGNLRLPRTLQIDQDSNHCLERMSIALFARNLFCFLKVDDVRFDDESYVKRFFDDFLHNQNPEDVVHRSFVDFMNENGLLSQQNFGLGWEEILRSLNKQAEEKNKTEHSDLVDSWQYIIQYQRVQTETWIPLQSFFNDDEADTRDPFHQLKRPQSDVFLLLWASTELLLNAARRVATQQSGDDETVSCLNVVRASIFGPSPRWLTSPDVRTNRGLSFLWEGVLNSDTASEPRNVAESNYSRLMSFNTEQIFFKNTLNAAWDDITGLVPVLPDFTKKEKQPLLLTSVFSLLFRTNAANVLKRGNEISFMAVSPFMELMVQSEAISTFARLICQGHYETFCKAQKQEYIANFPKNVEAPLICILFLLGIPTPMHFSTTTTSICPKHVNGNHQKNFSSSTPVFETKSTLITSIPTFTFPNIQNKSVESTNFPQILSETKRGETDFYSSQILQKCGYRSLPGIDALIVSRGSDATRETIFMPIQATTSSSPSLVEVGMVLIQQLLYQVMCHLEPSEGVVALFNSATTQMDPIFPSQTGIMGFHMVSSFLQFEENTLKHMPSILRHRNHPFLTPPTEPQLTMTTREITDTLLANVGHYPPFSTEFDPWTTTLSSVNNLTDPSLTLPFRWKPFYDVFWTQSTDGSTFEAPLPQIAKDGIHAKDWLDRMVRRTIQELNRVGISPDDLDESETERIEAFSSFVLCTAISCRRNELLRPTPMTISSADDAQFVRLVESIVGPLNSETLGDIPTTLSGQASTTIDSIREERIRSLDKLCRHPLVEARLHTVHFIMSNHAMKRIRTPAQEYLSVLQSQKDGGVFRVPARNDLSAILHCETVLLDNISPVSEVIATPTMEYDLPPLTSPITLTQAVNQLSNPPQLSPTTSEPPRRSKALRIPLHSFILAKYVVIDPSLFPQHVLTESLSLFTTFIHRLFDNPFIPVATTPSTEFPENYQNDEAVLLTHIQKLEGILNSINLEENPQFQTVFHKLSVIQTSEHATSIFSLVPEIRSCLQAEPILPGPSSLNTDIPQPGQSSRKGTQLSSDQVRDLIAATESIEALRPQPTLVFVKSGSGFFASPNKSCVDVVDTKTESRAFPIPFST